MTEIDNLSSEYSDSYDRKSKCSNMVVAMAYVPEQEWETPYEVLGGLDRGTLFPSLDKPFIGGGKRL